MITADVTIGNLHDIGVITLDHLNQSTTSLHLIVVPGIERRIAPQTLQDRACLDIPRRIGTSASDAPKNFT